MTKSKNKKLAIKPPNLFMAVIRHLLFRHFSALLLVTVTLISAFALVLLTHEKRQLFAELEKLHQERDRLDVEMRELRLEQRHLGEHTRLQDLAEKNLGLKTLDLKSERIIKQVKDSE